MGGCPNYVPQSTEYKLQNSYFIRLKQPPKLVSSLSKTIVRGTVRYGTEGTEYKLVQRSQLALGGLVALSRLSARSAASCCEPVCVFMHC